MPIVEINHAKDLAETKSNINFICQATEFFRVFHNAFVARYIPSIRLVNLRHNIGNAGAATNMKASIRNGMSGQLLHRRVIQQLEK